MIIRPYGSAVIVWIGALCGATAWAAPPPALAVPSDRTSAVAVPQVQAPVSFIRPYSWLFSAGGTLGASLGHQFGGLASVGYQFRRMAVDLRGSLGTTTYGAISVSPSFGDLDVTGVSADPESELARVRSDSDAWSYMMLEPGVSVTGQLFADWLPRLAERARFGLGLGSFADQVNQLKFLSITASFEGDLEYQLFPASRWALRLGGAWVTGVLKKSDDVRSTTARLPVSWLQAMVSVVYAL
jgi:hypothetical protein